MKLTEKDKAFLETLKRLVESRDLSVQLKPDRPSRMVLRGTYGERIHKAFRMTRQGVRWRFWRLFNDIYVSAFETILFVEKTFGTQLRDYAIRISKERWQLRQEATQVGFTSADVLQQSEAGSRQEDRKLRAEGDE
jgi:hypothetical protein